MSHAKFVLLQEPIAASEASNLLCRVVASKVAPLMAAAPFTSNEPDSTITTAIPKCSAPIKLTDFMGLAGNQGVAPQVSRLLNLQGMHMDEQTILLECRLVKRYLLPDPDTTFRDLMKSDNYSRDVRTLLDQCIARQGYFVTGFLTATDDSWLIEASQQELQQFNITMSYSDLVDTPVPFLYQDLLGPDLAFFSAPCEKPPSLSNEQIFAVSYKVAKLPQAMSPISSISGHLSPSTPPPPRRPKRTNAYHLAPRRTEEVWAPSTASSPETLSYYDDCVKLDDDDTTLLPMEDTAFVMV